MLSSRAFLKSLPCAAIIAVAGTGSTALAADVDRVAVQFVGGNQQSGLSASLRLRSFEAGAGLELASATTLAFRGTAGYAFTLYDERIEGRGFTLTSPLQAGILQSLSGASYTALELTEGLEAIYWLSAHLGFSARLGLGAGYMIDASPAYTTKPNEMFAAENTPFAEEHAIYPVARLEIGIAF